MRLFHVLKFVLFLSTAGPLHSMKRIRPTPESGQSHPYTIFVLSRAYSDIAFRPLTVAASASPGADNVASALTSTGEKELITFSKDPNGVLSALPPTGIQFFQLESWLSPNGWLMPKSTVTILTSLTTATFVPDASTLFMTVEGVGGGGGGGRSLGGSVGPRIGGGGGAGGYAIVSTPVLSADVFTYQCGNGVSASTSTGVITVGGTTTFLVNGATILSAAGGSSCPKVPSAAGTAQRGGAGGIPLIGTVRISGENGEAGVDTISGKGGSSLLGCGGNSAGGTATESGKAGKQYGSGGSGMYWSGGGSSTVSGGVGSQGAIIVTEYSWWDGSV